jgi:hypothetical protein
MGMQFFILLGSFCKIVVFSLGNYLLISLQTAGRAVCLRISGSHLSRWFSRRLAPSDPISTVNNSKKQQSL